MRKWWFSSALNDKNLRRLCSLL